MAVCRKCKSDKPDSEFYKNRRTCKSCVREDAKAYRDKPENKAKRREYHQKHVKEYRRRPEVKLKIDEYQKEYRRRPEVKAKQKTPECRNQPYKRKNWADGMYSVLHITPNDY